VVHAEARNDVDLRRVVPVGLLVEVHCLELVLLLLVQVAHFGEDFRVTGHLGDEDVVPLEGFTAHTDQLVNMSDLVQDFIAVGDDGVQLFEGLERLVVVAESLVDQAQVVDGLDAVGFHTDGLKEELLCAVEILVHEQGVTLVHKSF